MGSIFYQGSGIKIFGKMGLRDQNNGKKIGINGSRIYHVTTLSLGTLLSVLLGVRNKQMIFSQQSPKMLKMASESFIHALLLF